MFKKYKNVLPLILFVLAFILLFSLSSVSAGTHNLTDFNSTNDIQNIINNDVDSDLVINLDNGNYNLGQINISRNATIIGKSKDNVRISGTGVLFNVNVSNVKLINLTIIGYQTAIRSNSSDLSIIGCNMSTTNMSINCTGSTLTDILIENNTIFYSGVSSSYGAIYLNAPTGSKVNVIIRDNNITANGGTNSFGIVGNIQGSNNTLTFQNNNIEATGRGISLVTPRNNNNTVSLTNNNIIAGSGYGLYLNSGNSSNDINVNNNNITATSGECVRIEISTLSDYSVQTLNIKDNNLISTNGYTLCVATWNTGNATKSIVNIDNNNITCEGSSRCLELAMYNSTILLNMTNNSIMAVNRISYLAFQNGNSTMNFINNSVKSGIGSGLSIQLSNNTGTLNIFENNFTNANINCYGNTKISGIYILNNTITVIDNIHYSLVLNLTGAGVMNDILVKGNTIISRNNTAIFFNILSSINSVNVTVNYNRILGSVGLNFTLANDAGSNFDYNWWGIKRYFN